MLSSTTPPKTKTQLVQSINRLPSNVKFDVIEVSSPTEKSSMNRVVDQYSKRGSFSVILIAG
jgi:hypothetical protein